MKFKLILVVLSLFCLCSSNLPAKDKGNALPPGLAKRQHNTGKPLPPGWQKKLAKGDILSRDIYARGEVVVPLGSDGSISIRVEGTLIKLHQKTREILEILQ